MKTIGQKHSPPMTTGDLCKHPTFDVFSPIDQFDIILSHTALFHMHNRLKYCLFGGKKDC